MINSRFVIPVIMVGEMLVAGSMASEADGYRVVNQAVVVEAMSYVGGKTKAELWAPRSVLNWSSDLPMASATVEARPSAYDVVLYPTDHYYPVNKRFLGWGRVNAMIGEWGAYIGGTELSKWLATNVAGQKWPCRWGHNCRAAGKIAITKSLTGELWKTDEGLSDVTWTMGGWRFQCNAWPGPSTTTALYLAQRVLAQIKRYPLPHVAGTLSVNQGADSVPTVATWNDGKSVVYVSGIAPEAALPIISSMHHFRVSVP